MKIGELLARRIKTARYPIDMIAINKDYQTLLTLRLMVVVVAPPRRPIPIPVSTAGISYLSPFFFFFFFPN